MANYGELYLNDEFIKSYEEFVSKTENLRKSLSSSFDKISEQLKPLSNYNLSEEALYFHKFIAPELEKISKALESIDIDKISKQFASVKLSYNFDSLNTLVETAKQINVLDHKNVSENSVQQLDNNIKTAYQDAQKLKEDIFSDISIDCPRSINEQESIIESLFLKLSSLPLETKINFVLNILNFVISLTLIFNSLSSSALMEKDIESRQELSSLIEKDIKSREELITGVRELNQTLSASDFPDSQPKPVDFQAVSSELQEAHSDSQGISD